jgi:hypothetical protein
MTAVHRRSKAERDSRENKTAARWPNAETLSHFSFLPPLFFRASKRRAHRGREREREMVADDQPAGGAAPPAGPLAGVRRSPEGERAAVEPLAAVP